MDRSIMNHVPATLAQLLHMVLVIAAAPFLVWVEATTKALVSGTLPPPPWQGWIDLWRLCLKTPSWAESVPPAMRYAPVLCLTLAAVAAWLVPSFTLGMTFAAGSDLLVIAGLLAGSHLSLVLAGMAPGTALPGVAAIRTASFHLVAEPALFLVLLALATLGGTTNLDLLIGLQKQGMLQPIAASAIAAVALACIAFTMPDSSASRTEFSGAGLAMLDLAEALRRLTWISLIAGLFIPLGMAEAGGGVLAWISGLAAWVVKMAALTAAAALLRAVVGTSFSGRTRLILSVAAVSGLVAAVIALSSAVSA
jgi:formate hydrogenlyase subunit 4